MEGEARQGSGKRAPAPAPRPSASRTLLLLLLLRRRRVQPPLLPHCRAGKLLLMLAKAEAKQWFELRKSKGVGDTEFLKLVPDSGETRTIIV